MRMRKRMMVFAGMALSALLPVRATELPPIPEKPDMKRYESVPAPWHDYFLQARAAERIADPLRRCLAFPDLPGNKWPAGHAAAHCLIHHEPGIPTVAGIGASLDRGELPQLEASMQRLLDRHFSATDYSEAIHELFNYRFDAGEESDRVSAKWLALSPGSAFAHLARASHLASAAIQARGARYAASTPRENFRRMSELADQAISLYRQAIRIDPKLIAAHTGLLQIAMFDSRNELESEAFSAANKLDPACAELANVRMRSLEPRWGGDYEQMIAYSNTLSVNVARRPQLAAHMARPYGDRGAILLANEQYDREATEVLEIAVKTGSDEDALLSASDAARRIEKDENKAVAYLFQASRFNGLNSGAAAILSWYLVRLEPEISVRYAVKALEEKPDDAWAHYLAGAGYYNARAFDAADAHYRIAMEDREWRQASLREVAEMWLWSGDQRDPAARKIAAARAKPYIDQLTSEFPEDGRGMAMRLWHDAAMNERIMIEDVRALLPKLNRQDPWQARQAKRLEAMVDQADLMQKAAHKKP